MLRGTRVFRGALKVEISVDEQKLKDGLDSILKKAPQDMCKKTEFIIKHKLTNISTPQKIDELVSFAIKYPYNKCNSWHKYIMGSFKHYDIHPKKYKKFLLATLDTSKEPSLHTYKINQIMNYLNRDLDLGDIDIIVNLMSRMQNIFLVLNSKLYSVNKTFYNSLLEPSFSMIKEKKFGRPIFKNSDQMFASMIDDIPSAEFMSYYLKYEQYISKTMKRNKRFISKIVKIYRQSQDKNALNLYSEYFNNQEFTKQSIDLYWGYINTIKHYVDIGTTNKEVLHSFIKPTEKWMFKSLKNYPYKYMSTNRIKILNEINYNLKGMK